MQLDNVNSLDDFLKVYGEQLAAEARATLRPLHVSTDKVDLPPLLRTPFPAQANVMMAGVKALQRQPAVNFIAEMGTGKTIMSQGSAHAYCLLTAKNEWDVLVHGGRHGRPDGDPREVRKGMEEARTAAIRESHNGVYDVGAGKIRAILSAPGGKFTHAGRDWVVSGLPPAGPRPGTGLVYDVVVSARQVGSKSSRPTAFRSVCKGAYRVLVVCPTVLLEKWKRELLGTVPHAMVYTIDDYRQLLALADRWRCAREHISEKPPFKGNPAPFLPSGYEWYLIGKDKMKLSCGWEHSYVVRSVKKGVRINPKDYADGLPACPSCGEFVTKSKSKDDPVDEDYFGPKSARRKCHACGGQLWQEKAKPRRYSPSWIIKKRLKHFFKVSIWDEAHDYKSGDSLQADAMGGIASVTRKRIGLTGTLVGGYAWHVRTLLYRLGIARTLVSEGLGWSDEVAFNARYGKLVTKETIHPGEADAEAGAGRVYGRGSKKRAPQSKPEPGIVPTLFRHLIGNSVFLSLNEVAANLPKLDEDVIVSEMDPELKAAYTQLDREVTAAVRKMIVTGNKKALGMMLNVLLSYPDSPWNWDTVGYNEWVDGRKEFRYVATPTNLSPHGLRNKEIAVLDWAKGQVKKGHQVWLYGVFTDARDFQPRFVNAFKQDGLRVAVMRAKEVAPKDRERWIDVNGPKNDIIMSHPELVKTGLDFFNPKTGHNYSSIGFFQTGYNLFTVRQASRRAWRIGQKRRCDTKYFYYADSMQSRAMGLMGKKIQAAQALEGNFTAEGLAAMAGDDGSMEMELAKSLADQVDLSGSSRAWARVTDGGVESERRDVSPDEAMAAVMALMAELGMGDTLAG